MKRLITIAATVLALVLAATSAASASTTTFRSGTEVIVGSTTNLSIILANVSVLPVKAYGVVRTWHALAGRADERYILVRFPCRQAHRQAHPDQRRYPAEPQPEDMRG